MIRTSTQLKAKIRNLSAGDNDRAKLLLLSNPVYCGDVVFHRARRLVRKHHEGLVSRELWETVNGRRADKETREDSLFFNGFKTLFLSHYSNKNFDVRHQSSYLNNDIPIMILCSCNN